MLDLVGHPHPRRAGRVHPEARAQPGSSTRSARRGWTRSSTVVHYAHTRHAPPPVTSAQRREAPPVVTCRGSPSRARDAHAPRSHPAPARAPRSHPRARAPSRSQTLPLPPQRPPAVLRTRLVWAGAGGPASSLIEVKGVAEVGQRVPVGRTKGGATGPFVQVRDGDRRGRSGVVQPGRPELSHGVSALAAPNQLRGALGRLDVLRGPRH